jgi:hypothetical protein
MRLFNETQEVHRGSARRSPGKRMMPAGCGRLDLPGPCQITAVFPRPFNVYST